MHNRKKPSKHKINFGARVIKERIYDSRNGKSCHQCRQKTMDFVASCKVMKKNNQFTIKFCHKSSSLRYGEMAREVAKLNDWICPQCKGIWNWIVCRSVRPLFDICSKLRCRVVSIQRMVYL